MAGAAPIFAESSGYIDPSEANLRFRFLTAGRLPIRSAVGLKNHHRLPLINCPDAQKHERSVSGLNERLDYDRSAKVLVQRIENRYICLAPTVCCYQHLNSSAARHRQWASENQYLQFQPLSL